MKKTNSRQIKSNLLYYKSQILKIYFRSVYRNIPYIMKFLKEGIGEIIEILKDKNPARNAFSMADAGGCKYSGLFL